MTRPDDVAARYRLTSAPTRADAEQRLRTRAGRDLGQADLEGAYAARTLEIIDELRGQLSDLGPPMPDPLRATEMAAPLSAGDALRCGTFHVILPDGRARCCVIAGVGGERSRTASLFERYQADVQPAQRCRARGCAEQWPRKVGFHEEDQLDA